MEQHDMMNYLRDCILQHIQRKYTSYKEKLATTKCLEHETN